ncbi:hypothetical protein [Leifsonia sp. EB34]|uniref:hypothetical protein n=1 Tax=Leifsonia sp. EB34 TaxID=3156303 RepID=UPI0035183631
MLNLIHARQLMHVVRWSSSTVSSWCRLGPSAAAISIVDTVIEGIGMSIAHSHG